MVADDRVAILDGRARAPDVLAGLLEVRGLGIVRLPYLAEAKLEIVIALLDRSKGERSERLPEPDSHASLGLPLVRLDGASASAPDKVALALDCALGRVVQIAGAFAA